MTKPILIALGAAAALTLTLPLTAQTAPKTPGSQSTAAITGGTYTADAGHTMVVWTLDHLGFTPYSGIFGDITGTLTLDPKNPAGAKVDVTIPVSKATTASAGLTKHLFKPAGASGKADFFGATPADAKFVSTKVVMNGAHKAKISGDLTLNGVTKPITIDATFYGAGKAPPMMGGKENVGFTGKATIMRSQFGIGYGVPMVGDAVTLDIMAGFQK